MSERVLRRRRPAPKPRALPWKNRAGQRFEFIELNGHVVPELIHAATACDANGDGRSDLVAFGKARHLLLNVAIHNNRFLALALRDGGREPIGAIVRAVYSDGSSVARRWGSAHNTTFSQAVLPLLFGVREGVEVERVGVCWPGESEEVVYEAGELNSLLLIER